MLVFKQLFKGASAVGGRHVTTLVGRRRELATWRAGFELRLHTHGQRVDVLLEILAREDALFGSYTHFVGGQTENRRVGLIEFCFMINNDAVGVEERGNACVLDHLAPLRGGYVARKIGYDPDAEAGLF